MSTLFLRLSLYSLIGVSSSFFLLGQEQMPVAIENFFPNTAPSLLMSPPTFTEEELEAALKKEEKEFQEKNPHYISTEQNKPLLSPPRSPLPSPAEVDAGVYPVNDSLSTISESAPSSPRITSPLLAPSTGISPWDFTLHTGYVSNYDYKGMVINTWGGKSGVMNYIVDARRALNTGGHLNFSFQHTDIMGGALSAQNETWGSLGYSDEVLPDVFFCANYTLVHGGFSGFYNQNRQSHEITQSLDVTTRLNFSNGMYTSLGVSAAFYGMTGWWFTAEVGYDYRINEQFMITTSSSLSASTAYWQTGGINQVNFQLSGVYTWEDCFLITPFIQTAWLGNTGLSLNSHARERILRPFTVMAGVQFSWKF